MKEKSSSSPSPTNSEATKDVEPPSFPKYSRGLSDGSTGEDNPNYSGKLKSTGISYKVNKCIVMKSFYFISGGGVKNNDYTIFNQILFLGAASINAPRSEMEVQKNMGILNSQKQAKPIEVSVSIPSNSDGHVM